MIHASDFKHPSDANLQAYAFGDLSLEECASLESHLQGCEACGARFDAISLARDSFVGKLRKSPEGNHRIAANVDSPRSESSAEVDTTIDLAHSQDTTNPDAPRPAPDPSWPVIAGYQITAVIAKGGMGCVFAARDLTLNRDVAIKTLLPRARPERFITEAKITSQLPHPGIPPVHALGKLADGSPFLVMKLIQGRTLAELLNELPHGLASQEELGKFLQIFEQIALAVGFAHSQGILHRDLKPLNVMVGAFGEVQVMDWGLAKELSGGAALPQSERESAVSEHAVQERLEHTFAGAIMGTPGYMSPEQARGETVDARTDVFSLGALLTTILTGKPAFTGATSREIVQRAAKADLAETLARLQSCGAPQEVVELAQKCLAPARADRPLSAEQVASAVASYRASVETRVRQAEADRAAAQVREAEQIKLRRVWIGLAATLLLGIAVASGLAAWANHARHQEKLARQEVSQKKAELETALGIVSDRTKSAFTAFDQLVFGIQSKLEFRPDTQDLRRHLLQHARDGLTKILAGARQQDKPDRTLVYAHLRMGDVELNLGNSNAAAREFEKALQDAQALVAAAPNDPLARETLMECHFRLGDLNQRLGQTKLAQEHISKAKELNPSGPGRSEHSVDRNTLLNLAKAADLKAQSGLSSEALSELEQAQLIAEKLVAVNRGDQSLRDLSNLQKQLGKVHQQMGKHALAAECFTRALALDQQLVTDEDWTSQHALANSYSLLGALKIAEGQPQAASEYFEKDLQTLENASARDPKNTRFRTDICSAHLQLGDAMQRLGQTQLAKTHNEQALAIARQLLPSDPKNRQLQRMISQACGSLGNLAADAGLVQMALEYHQQALTQNELLAAADESNLEAQRDLAISAALTGELLGRAGQLAEARAAGEKCLAIHERLVKAEPKNRVFQLGHAGAHEKLAATMHRLADPDLTREHYAKALAIAQQVLDDNPADADAMIVIAESYEGLGSLEQELLKYPAAIEYFQKKLAIDLQRAELDPNDAQAQHLLATAYDHLGNAHFLANQIDEAEAHFKKGLEICKNLVKIDSTNLGAQQNLFVAHFKLANIAKDRHEYAAAKEAFKQAKDVLLPFQNSGKLGDKFAQAIPQMDQEIAKCVAAERALNDLDFISQQEPAQARLLFNIRIRANLQRGQSAAAEAAAEKFAEYAGAKGELSALVYFDCARAFALCAAANNVEQDKLVERVVELLAKGLEGGNYAPKAVVRYVQDPDFAGIRAHAKLVEFLAGLESAAVPASK